MIKETATKENLPRQQVSDRVGLVLKDYPKPVFIGMIALIVISIVCFFLFRPARDAQKQALNLPALPTSSMPGSNGILDGAADFAEMMRLQEALGIIFQKQTLTREDSLFVEEIATRMKIIEDKIRQKP